MIENHTKSLVLTKIMNVFTLCCAAIRATTLVFKGGTDGEEENQVHRRRYGHAYERRRYVRVRISPAPTTIRGKSTISTVKPEVVDQFQELADEYTKETRHTG